MLDIKALDESLKLRSLGRLLVTKHPCLSMIREYVRLDQFFDPSVGVSIDEVATNGLRLLAKDRDKLWKCASLDTHRELLNAVAEMDIRKMVSARGSASVPFYMLWVRGARRVKDLNVNMLASIERYIEQSKLGKIKLAIRTRAENVSEGFLKSYLISDKFKLLEGRTSKEIRDARTDKTPIKEFKIGLNLTSIESTSWGLKLSKLSSTRHKNVLL